VYHHIYQPSNRSPCKAKKRRHPISLKYHEKYKVQHIKTAGNEFGSQLDLPISPFRLLNSQFLGKSWKNQPLNDTTQMQGNF
jgi:hypothetical protein